MLCPMQTKQDLNRLLTTGEAAAMLSVSTDTLKRWEKSGRISAMRTPTGHRRFSEAEVAALLKPGVSARKDVA